MIEKLKQYPLVGVALAIAAGLVLAHIVNGLGDYLWHSFLDDPDDVGWATADLSVLAALLCLVVWKRQVITAWFKRHGTKIGFCIWWGVFSIYFVVLAVAFIRHHK